MRHSSRVWLLTAAACCCVLYTYNSAQHYSSSNYHRRQAELATREAAYLSRFASDNQVDERSNASSAVLSLYNADTQQYTLQLHNATAQVKFPVQPDPLHVCGHNTWLTVFVLSLPSHRALRDTIRETWAHPLYALNGRVVFVIGQTLKGLKQEELIAEYNNYGDLLISNQIEDYDRLPWKVAAMLLWAAVNCNAHFYMKTDDDMLILPPKIHELLSRFNAVKSTPAIYGHCYDWAPVNRDGKWAIPRSVVAEDYFPRYCAGAGYVLTGASLPALIAQWPHTPLIHIEDAWLTGLVAAKADVPQITIDYLPSCIVMDACNVGYKIMYHRPGYSPDELRQLWRDLPDVKSNFVCWRPNCYFANGRYCYAFIKCAYEEKTT